MGKWRFISTIPVLDGGECSASRPCRFIPWTHLIGWVGPRAGLDAVEKRKIFCPFRESNPGRPACSLSLYRLDYPASSCYAIKILITF
jgi:hypothetical protein